MDTNDLLATAAALRDRDLLATTEALAANERGTSVLLVAHLAALDMRPSAYAALGYGSLFRYCTQALRLSEDAACNRIEAAHACRRFPVLLDHLATGEMSLTSIRKLGRHLTQENVDAVLARARKANRATIDALVAELAPRPDVVTLVRRLPDPTPRRTAANPETAKRPPSAGESAVTAAPAAPPSSPLAVTQAAPPPPRPVIQPTSPQRYRVQFTVGEDTHTKLRRLQALLRREIPDGDPAAIVDRALDLLLAKVEKAKTGQTRPPETLPIRSRTDTAPRAKSRHVPREVQRTVWSRDGGRCAFVSPDGRRCAETTFLELHHIHPYALDGPPTGGNIALRCRRHNQYEAERVFGPWVAAAVT